MEGVTRAAKRPQTPNTLRLIHPMEERKRQEIAARITQLRERSRFTQPQIATELGLTLRGYQKLEEKGTTKWERAEELAKLHGVSAYFIWDGEEKGETPDPFVATESAEAGDEIQAKLDELLDRQRELLATVETMHEAQGLLLQAQGLDAPSETETGT